MSLKYRADNSDYLQKASGTSWADCKAQVPPSVGSTDLGVTAVTLVGRGYYIDPKLQTQNWVARRMYWRFNTYSLRVTHEILSGAIRLYLSADESETDGELYLVKLHDPYGWEGVLQATDWDATGEQSATTYSMADVATDEAGQLYLDLELADDILATIEPRQQLSFMLKHTLDSAVAAPTDKELLSCHSAQQSTAALKPVLTLVTRSLREQVLEAVKAQLEGIDTFASYHTTAQTVERGLKSLTELRAGNYPAVFSVFDPQGRETDAGLRTLANTIDLTLLVAVHNTNAVQRQSDLEAAIDDVTRAIEAADRLGISDYVTTVEVAEIAQYTSGDLGGDVGAAFIRVFASYLAGEGGL